MTEYIKWQENFSTGHPGVDFEHKELIEDINQTLVAINGSRDTKTINGMLGDIYVEINAHFALEEEAMRKAQYPEYQEHKDDHELLLEEIRQLMDQFDGALGKHIKARFAGRLIGWFTVHFSKHDAKLHDVIG